MKLRQLWEFFVVRRAQRWSAQWPAIGRACLEWGVCEHFRR